MSRDKLRQQNQRLSKEASKWEKQLKYWRGVEAKRKAEGKWLSGAEKHKLNSALARVKQIPLDQLKLNKQRSERIAHLTKEIGAEGNLAELEKSLASLPSLRASQGNHMVAQQRSALKGKIARIKESKIELDSFKKDEKISKGKENLLAGREKVIAEQAVESDLDAKKVFQAGGGKEFKTNWADTSKLPGGADYGQVAGDTKLGPPINYNEQSKVDTAFGTNLEGLGIAKPTSDEPKYRSDVFTINPETGEAVGVMTRAQRRKFDIKYQDELGKWAEQNKDKLRVYKNKGKTTHTGGDLLINKDKEY